MKDFLKYTLASIVGVFVSFFILSVMFFFFFVFFLASMQLTTVEDIPANSVLEIKLNYVVEERALQSFNAVSSFPFVSIRKEPGLNEIVKTIRKAKYDSDKRGIYLNLNNFVCGGYTVVDVIRKELKEFKKSGKFIIAFGDDVTQKAYYFASVADKIFITPEGSIEFKGLGFELMYFKNTLDKLGIEAQIFKAGKFKSAVEIFSNTKMSDADRQQNTELINSIYSYMLNEMSAVKNISVDSLKLFADNLLVQSPENAYKLKMIDSIIYKDQCLNYLKQISGIKSNGKVKLVRLENYALAKLKQQPASSKRIAVIYAVGEILNTYGDQSTIGIENIPAAIKKAREDSRVKAIVLRVDSPGGDPTTSDIIWREIEITKKIKPVIVSMGRVAASGGYYISCGADTIVAEPTTLAGSIGVYGIIPNMQGFFNNKLGITFDRVTTGKYSDYFSLNRPLRADESKIVQSRIDKIYETFVSKVSIGRKMTYEEINEIAQGRVWSGLQAKDIGLVDVLGGLDDAIKIAATKAKISGYSVVEYPALKSLFESILEDFPAEVKADLLQKELGGQYKYYQYLNRIKNYVGFQARLPFDMEVY